MSAAPHPPDGSVAPQEGRRATWKRVFLWTGTGLLVLIVVAVIGIFVLLKSRTAHDYVLRTVQQRASDALGSNIQVRDYTLNFSGISPELDLYGVVVEGAAPYPTRPLLQIEHVRVGIRIVSVFQRKWYLNDVQVIRPVVRVFVDKDGVTNLPKPKTSQQQGGTNIFDLGVRHALLQDGEFYYNDRKSVIAADLHDLDFQTGFDAAQRRYSGTLKYRDGHLNVQNFRTIPHDIDARFDATPDRFTLQQATLRSGGSKVVLNATLDGYSNPHVTATYDAAVNAGELRHIMRNQALPAGIVRLAGTLNYGSRPNQPLLQALKLDGTLSSAVLHLRTPALRGDVRDVAARYSLESGNIDIRNFRARLLGGELSGTLQMRDLTGATRSRLNADLHGVSLAELRVLSPALQKMPITGSASAKAEAAWGRTFDNLVAKADATLQAQLNPAAASPQPAAVPLNAVIHARYTATTKQVTLSQTYVRTRQTAINLNGTVSDRSALTVNVRSNDLHEIETLANAFIQPSPDKPTLALGLFGTADFTGTVRGSTKAPRMAGTLSAANLRVKDSAWRELRARVDASPSNISIQEGRLESAKRGRLTFAAEAGLRNWAYSQGSSIRVRLNAEQMNVTELARLAGSTAPVSGTLSADVNVRGTQLNPVGNGTVSLTKAKIADEPIDSAKIAFNGTGDTLHGDFALRSPAGAAKGIVTYLPKSQGYDVQLQANGVRLDQLQSVRARKMDITGVLNLNASGRGTLDNPHLNATAEIPKLDVRGQTLSGLLLRADVANHVANVTLDSHVVNTQVRGRGTIDLRGDYNTVATLDTQSIPLQPLVAAYAPSQAGFVSGQTELHASIRGPLKDKSRLEAHATIPKLAVNYKNALQLDAPQPIRIDYTNGVLNLQRAALRGTGTDLQMQGTIPVVDRNAPVALLLVGTVDLQIAQLFNPDLVSSGQLQFDINSYGQRADPNVQGQVRIVNASLATEASPLGLQNGNGILTLTKDRLNITSFQGTVGGGTVRARGGILYRPNLRFDLALLGEGVRMLYADSVRTGFDTNVTLTGTLEASALRGQVNITQLSLTPEFDLTGFAGQFGGTVTPPPSQGFTSNLQLDLAVRSTSGMNLSSRELSLQGNAALQVRGTAADPVITGRVNLNAGDLIFRGNRYLIQSGTIDFINPNRTQPVLNVAVNTTVEQYNIAMRFEGPVDHLRTSYNSDPALPPADIINLLVFGKTTEAEAANPNPPGTLGAQSAVASFVASQATSRVEKIAGISHLSIDPTLGSNQQNPGANLTIQQRVTSKFFVTFSTDVTSTQRQVIQFQYDVSRGFGVSGTRDQNGGIAVDTRFRKSW